MVGRLRRQAARVLALVVLVAMYQVGQLPASSAGDLARTAAAFEFEPLAIAMPSGLSTQTIRPVNQAYDRIPAWVSSVGAGVATTDLTGDGLANDLCVSEPRIDQVVVTPAPLPDQEPRYQPFPLDPGRLPVDRTMAPMGCVPGDYNGDGWTDLLVYYWGRTPIVFLARGEGSGLGAAAFRPVEMVDGASAGGRYVGPQWNTNAVAVADFDGDGHEDVFVGNYWPHSPVLDADASGGVAMPDSLSYALNGGDSYIYRWSGGTAGPEPDVSYTLAEDALPEDVAPGWVLASGATDLDGDLLPELYIAHDFGLDRLLHNRSEPGTIRFGTARAERDPLVPKSKALGRDSFKGMGVDFGDLDGDGQYDIFVSNITTSYGIQESNFAFVDDTADRAELAERLASGTAPYTDRSADLGLAWSGWGWDAKIADLDNSGTSEVVQTTGFIKGRVDRWPQMQEMAAANDELLSDPFWWPHLEEGDDVAGDQHVAFFARGEDGRFMDLSAELGMDVPVPTRGVGVGDADGDGRLDLAVARQWEAPVFYHNESPSAGEFLGLRLTRPGSQQQPDGTDGLAPAGSPVVGAQVTVTTPDGRTLLGRVDGGSGHAGKRSHQVVVGLGEQVSGPLPVTLTWRDRTGQPHEQTLRLAPGWHSVQLGAQAEEVGR